MASLLIAVGMVILAVIGIDVVWTVLAAGSGAGPLTARLSALAWRVALSIGRRSHGPRHALLATVGEAIIAGDAEPLPPPDLQRWQGSPTWATRRSHRL